MIEKLKRISDCTQCAFAEAGERVYTDDSFEMIFPYFCKATGKQLSKYTETFDKIKIPDWCPIKDTELTKKTVENEKPTPKHFVGKTIAAVNFKACNELLFKFSDGSMLALHIDCSSHGLPMVQVCNTCIEQNMIDGLKTS